MDGRDSLIGSFHLSAPALSEEYILGNVLEKDDLPVQGDMEFEGETLKSEDIDSKLLLKNILDDYSMGKNDQDLMETLPAKEGVPAPKQFPGESYWRMITKAILSSPDRCISLQSLFKFISQNYPFFYENANGWQSPIEDYLRRSTHFVKALTKNIGNSSSEMWVLNPATEHRMITRFNRGSSKKIQRGAAHSKIDNTAKNSEVIEIDDSLSDVDAGRDSVLEENDCTSNNQQLSGNSLCKGAAHSAKSAEVIELNDSLSDEDSGTDYSLKENYSNRDIQHLPKRSHFGVPTPKHVPEDSYCRMITKAILSSPGRSITLQRLFLYISQNYTYFSNKPDGWQIPIINYLQRSSHFVKVLPKNFKEGSPEFWILNPVTRSKMIARFNEGSFRKTKVNQWRLKKYKNGKSLYCNN